MTICLDVYQRALPAGWNCPQRLLLYGGRQYRGLEQAGMPSRRILETPGVYQTALEYAKEAAAAKPDFAAAYSEEADIYYDLQQFGDSPSPVSSVQSNKTSLHPAINAGSAAVQSSPVNHAPTVPVPNTGQLQAESEPRNTPAVSSPTSTDHATQSTITPASNTQAPQVAESSEVRQLSNLSTSDRSSIESVCSTARPC